MCMHVYMYMYSANTMYMCIKHLYYNIFYNSLYVYLPTHTSQLVMLSCSRLMG